MRIFTLTLLLAIFATFGASQNWTLVFSDEFDGTSLDLKKWAYEVDCYGGGNAELQCYTARPENVAITDGKLVLRAKRETYTGTANDCTSINGGCTDTKGYTSGRIRTRFSPEGSWLYGKVEVRAKLPNGKHLWPAIWMLPTDDFYGVWAASGEIDIMEARGQKPTISSSTLHYGGTWPNNRNTGHEQDWATDLTNSFHVYGLEWTENEMIFRMDDTEHFRIDLNRNWYGGAGANPYNANRQPWDWRFHLILNMAIGGGFFNGYPPLTPAEADLWSDPTLAIDWVHVYQDLSFPDPHGVVPAGSVNDTAAGTWSLVWSDEFDGNAIDGSKWVHEVDCNGGGNNEYQCYTSRSENSVVRDGKLIITAKHEHYTANGQTRDYTSARLRGLQAWKYGKVSASIKLPNGKHLWPAFWMLPQDNVYGQWAASGEIDIMEAKGERINSSSSALHFGGGWPNNRFVMHEQDWGKDLSTGFHEFSVEWNSEWMAFSVDNEEHFRVNLTRNWYGGVGPNPYKAEGQPWDQKFHLMINMAVAGGFFKGFPPLSFADADAWADPTYAIDWVRVYEWVPGN